MADMEAVKQELSSVEKRLGEQVARAKRQQMISLIIGAVLVVFVSIYFMVIKHYINEMTDPKELSAIASGYVQEQVPEVRAELERMALESAPELVDNLVDRLIEEQFPSLRADGVAFIKSETSSRIEKLTEMLEIAMDDLVESHRDNIERLSEQLDTPEGVEAFEQEVYEMILVSINDDEIRETLDVYQMGLEDITDRLIRISEEPEENLMPEELVVRNLVAIIREMAARSSMEGSLLDINAEILTPLE